MRIGPAMAVKELIKNTYPKVERTYLRANTRIYNFFDKSIKILKATAEILLIYYYIDTRMIILLCYDLIYIRMYLPTKYINYIIGISARF